MDFEKVVEQYHEQLKEQEFEIIKTPRLGWIAIMTEYMNYSDSIRQFRSPIEMETFIKERILLREKTIKELMDEG